MLKPLLFTFLLLFLFSISSAESPSDLKLKMLYNSIAHTSISQHFAFYELYPQHPLGQKSLEAAWKLLLREQSSSSNLKDLSEYKLQPELLHSIIGLINKSSNENLPELDDATLQILFKVSANLSHYALKGHHVWTEYEVLQLPLEEVDLARAIFISQLGNDKRKILSYEAVLDLMALQILVRLPPNASSEQKIYAINYFVFEEMDFRFPPHSIYSKQVDIYTFLPSVLDSHRGVCLGVSVLYLTLAQRLNLTLEMITPPGHIYVRYREGDQLINIETTARGIHIDCEEYLSVDTRALQTRNIREVVGLSQINQSSIFLQDGDYEKALTTYLKAAQYLPDDPLLKELLGYSYLFLGRENEAKKLLSEISGYIPPHAIYRDSMAEDYLRGYVDVEGLKAIFKRSEEDRESKLAKKEALETAVKNHPLFRSGLLNLAMIWMDLHRMKEALQCLEKYHLLNPNDPSVEYYLAMLYQERLDYKKAWEHLRRTEEIVRAKNYYPKELKELRQALIQKCPE